MTQSTYTVNDKTFSYTGPLLEATELTVTFASRTYTTTLGKLAKFNPGTANELVQLASEGQSKW